MTIERERGRKGVPRSTPIGTERGTAGGTAERCAERQAERPIKADAKTLARQSRARSDRRNAARNAKRNESVSGRSADRSKRNALANAGEHTPAYAPSKTFPVRVIAGATQAEQARQVAADLTAPEAAATRIIVTAEGKSVAGEWLDVPGTLAELRRVAGQVNAGDLSHAEAMLMNQAQAMQTLATRLIERGFGQEMFCHFEGFLRLGLRAQAQSRQALETLAVLKQGPAVFARQANVAHGPQQVVNGSATSASAPAIENRPTLLSLPHEQRVDRETSRRASGADQTMAAVGEKHRAEDT